MTQTALVHKISHQVEQLPLDLQHKVLDFTEALTRTRAKGVPGKRLLRFVGAIDKEDLEVMRQSIESECERVDEDGW